MSSAVTICVSNQSTLLSDGDFRENVAAVQAQVSGDFKAAWAIDATLTILEANDKAPLGAYGVVFKDNSDVDGDLGYHLDAAGIPTAYIFMDDCQSNGDTTGSICFSHEVTEMLADPACTKTASDGHGRLWSYEIADPVEGNSYVVDGVRVSNFVLPAFFEPGPHAPYDHLGVLKSSFTVAGGGYAEIYTQAHGWQTTWGPSADRGRARHRSRAAMSAMSAGAGQAVPGLSVKDVFSEIGRVIKTAVADGEKAFHSHTNQVILADAVQVITLSVAILPAVEAGVASIDPAAGAILLAVEKVDGVVETAVKALSTAAGTPVSTTTTTKTKTGSVTVATVAVSVPPGSAGAASATPA